MDCLLDHLYLFLPVTLTYVLFVSFQFFIHYMSYARRLIGLFSLTKLSKLSWSIDRMTSACVSATAAVSTAGLCIWPRASFCGGRGGEGEKKNTFLFVVVCESSSGHLTQTGKRPGCWLGRREKGEQEKAERSWGRTPRHRGHTGEATTTVALCTGR